ncbi:GNAT family N-acetyltransferase [Paenibacillus sp. 1001270B_150601_E10]|uniref:GNAT family N-acetyltransferase n=1 Tax=Paenibacillus sp. 1001270B_150601_E10 TaxID=2787079 RepID=UPI001E465EC3|nr:N-acetyltransferase [Paenibacillus sp. 1001270B_150601_E10]
MITIRLADDVESIARFMAAMNGKADQHVGYCGTQAEEIYHTLCHDFSELPLEQSMVAAYEEDELIGVLGLDIDEEQHTAEIWGPFVSHPKWEEMSQLMWNRLLSQIPVALTTAYGFYNAKHGYAASLMSRLGAERIGEHTVLRFQRDILEIEKPENILIEALTERHYSDFKLLHQAAFKEAYYSAEEILSQVDSTHKVFAAIHDDKLIGYVYTEAEPAFEEGHIHFIAVDPAARKQGLGTALLRHALSFLMSFDAITSLSLCVNQSNQGVMSIYERAGFERLYELVNYRIHV